MPQEFITIDYLATFAGMVAVVALVVQFTKGIIKSNFEDWAVRLYTLAWAWVLQGFVCFVQGRYSIEHIGLAVLNGILVALAASGAYEVVADPKAKKS